jgi:preprotein translocase subunit Sec63
MSSSIAGTQLLSLLSWTFLPSLLSRFLLSGYYTALPDARPRVSSTSTPDEIKVQNARAQAHHKNALIALIGSYLLFTLVSTVYAQSSSSQQNFYTLLGLSRSVVELEGQPAVKSRWRTLARTHHPDKVGKGGEALFVALRRGVDCLSDDEKRWAYERFGPGVLDWGKIAGYREWLVRGAYQSIAFYVFALLSIWLISVIRKEERKNGYVSPLLSSQDLPLTPSPRSGAT